MSKLILCKVDVLLFYRVKDFVKKRADIGFHAGFSERRRSGVFIVNFEHILHLFPAFLLLNYDK